MSNGQQGFGFAPEHDMPIPYRQRISTYYQALGYGAPYRWAQYVEVPFAPLRKALGESRIGLITTAAPYQPGKGHQGPGAAYNGAAKFYRVYSGDTAIDHDLRIAHIAYDRVHTTAEDSNSWFPLPALRRAAAAGRIGELAPRFHGAPTNRSHRATLNQDCPDLLARVREDRSEAVVLVAV
jgi:D-proline reductase (dithiol) PrdB